MSHDAIVEAWIGALRQAYTLEYRSRLRELRGQRNRLFDARGLEPFSETMGRIWAFQEVVPDLKGLFVDHHLIRSAARADAAATFREELIHGTDTGAARDPTGVAARWSDDG